MKKTVLFLLTVICLVSCTRTVYIDPETGKETEVDAVYFNGCKSADYKLVDATVNGETHQYIKYGMYGGLAHWAGCKYCKEKKNED